MITRGPRSRHLHIAFAVLQENKYAKPAHECYLQLPARASRAATLPNKTVNAMLAYDIKEGGRLLSKLLPAESKVT